MAWYDDQTKTEVTRRYKEKRMMDWDIRKSGEKGWQVKNTVAEKHRDALLLTFGLIPYFLIKRTWYDVTFARG